MMERLLLVEPNPLFRDGLALLFEWRTGLSSVCAGSLAEAERILEDANRRPACVIVDLDLPDGDGIELLKQLNGLPGLALIGSHSMDRRAQALESGAGEVVRTAGPVEKIVAAVERLIGSKSNRRVRFVLPQP
jgi:two-component system, OmpR family, KDP operon response regulator KdpE